ncbi:TetR/AcrR family transcriptional regulator [Thiomicrorhabdus sp. HH1]|uniref:TetR/AcrR family transcriptional regulator n=2 Tax=Thiomicrorhabdus heinhorstiae TaxID=2748010 RepID=A0ABS0BYQ1_9GAMM|nr:TetR/AcrR family transcriptional regulator [Thiomicrorhabdus heinhorstiae]
MAKSPNKKQQTRQKIVESAAQLFTAHGFDKVSIDDIMHNAQLTRGGFYAHFSSKEALYSEAITSAASLSFAARIPAAELSDQERLLLLLKSYLSENHLSDTNPACPLAFLATDVAHQNDEVRDAYTTVYKRLAIYIARLMAESPNSDRVLALSAMMIGGVAVARSLNDEWTRVKLLTACEKTAQELIRKRDGKTTV